MRFEFFITLKRQTDKQAPLLLPLDITHSVLDAQPYITSYITLRIAYTGWPKKVSHY